MDDSNFIINSNYDSLNNDIFMPQLMHWYSQIQYQQINPVTNPVYINDNQNTNNNSIKNDIFSNILLATLSKMTTPSLSNDTYLTLPIDLTASLIQNDGVNCSFEHLYLYEQAKLSFRPIILTLNILIYIIIVIGILFNILNLVVLLNSKLNESPYTYLTILALSDLGALLMVAAEKTRQLFSQTTWVQNIHVFVIAPAINIFLSTSMYITLALTIERFIFVYSPFKVVSFGRKSIARRVCAVIFIFSILRSLYLPFMYSPNCSNGYNQKSTKLIDIYEFLISLAIPYTIIFIANISLIQSLKKQNNLMNVTLFTNNSFSLNGYSTNNSSNNTLNKSTTRTKRSDTLISSELHSLFEVESNKPKRKSIASLELKSLKSETPTANKSKLSNFKHSSSSSLPSKIESIGPGDANLSTSFTNTLNNTCHYKTSILYHRTSSLRELRNQRKLTTTLIIILCLLLVCYLPSFLFEESLADVIFGSHENPEDPNSIRAFKIKSIGYRISIVLIYFNCSCNFLIYCFCNKKFKNSLKILMKKFFLYKRYLRIKTSILRCIYFKKTKNLSIYNSHLAQDKNYLQCLTNKNRVSLKKIVEEREQTEHSSNSNRDTWLKEKESIKATRPHSTIFNECNDDKCVKSSIKIHDGLDIV